MKLKSQRPKLDARALGALCDSCPLNAATPVGPQRNPNARLIVIGEGPGKTEVLLGVPFVGESGRLIDRIFEHQSIPRARLHITNALLCPAPANLSTEDWHKALSCCRPRLEKELAAVKCKTVLALGNRGLQALTGKQSIFKWFGAELHGTVWRGEKDLKLARDEPIPTTKKGRRQKAAGAADLDGEPEKARPSDDDPIFDFRHLSILPALHPAHCLRNPEWTPVLMIHLARAWLLANGKLEPWRWPRIVTNVGPRDPKIKVEHEVSEAGCKRELRRMLKLSNHSVERHVVRREGQIEKRNRSEATRLGSTTVDPGSAPPLGGVKARTYHIGLDIETIGGDIFEAELLNVGFADNDAAVSIDWRAASKELKSLSARLTASPAGKDMHNGQFDDLMLALRDMPVANFDHDTMLAFATVWPRLKKGLSVASAIEFHCERWKTKFRAGSDDAGAARFARADPYERAVYNAKDASAQWHLRERMEARLNQDPALKPLFKDYMELNVVATAMRKTGVRVNRSKFAHHRRILMRRRRDAKRELNKLAASLGASLIPNKKGELCPFKPGNSAHVTHILVEKLGVVPHARSKKPPFNPSFTEPVLLDLIPTGSPAVRLFCKQLLKYRGAGKLVSTYIDGLEVLATGRVHPNWNPSGAVTGRWSSSEPNMQNVPEDLRDLFIASEGKWLVTVDFKQFEAFTLGLLCGDPKLLELLKGDIHSATARAVFAPLLQLEKRDITEDERQLVKTPRYAVHYGAKVETVWKDMVKSIPNIAMSTVERLYNFIRDMHPRMLEYQRTEYANAVRNDYITAPLSGRRYQFYGLVEDGKVKNLPNQMTVADVINAVIKRVAKRLAPDESILAQVHDEIVCEGQDPKRLGAMLKEECQREVELNGVRVSFPVSVWYGKDWKNIEKLELPS